MSFISLGPLDVAFAALLLVVNALLSIVLRLGLAKQMLTAIKRGAAMKVDLGSDWDFWPYVELSLDVARQRLGVPPPA